MDNVEKKHIDRLKEVSWNIIELYYKKDYKNRLIRHQVESYNNFVTYQIKQTINMFNPFKVSSYLEDTDTNIDIIINFSNLKILRPQIFENNGSSNIMTPNDARLRNFTYSGRMTMDLLITYEIRDNLLTDKSVNVKTVTKKMSNINIGKIPIMLNSCLCTLKHSSSCPTFSKGRRS